MMAFLGRPVEEAKVVINGANEYTDKIRADVDVLNIRDLTEENKNKCLDKTVCNKYRLNVDTEETMVMTTFWLEDKEYALIYGAFQIVKVVKGKIEDHVVFVHKNKEYKVKERDWGRAIEIEYDIDTEEEQ